MSRSAALAFAALLLAAPALAQESADLPPDARASIEKGTAWLIGHRNSDGGWGCGEPPTPSSTGITGLAILALDSGGNSPTRGPHGEAIDRGVAYLQRRADEPSGAILGEYVTEFGPAYDHACASLGLATIFGMLPDESRARKLREVLEKAARYFARTQEADGGWTRYGSGTSDPMVTATAWLALRTMQSSGIEVPMGREAIEQYSHRSAVGYGGMVAGTQGINDAAGWLRIMYGLGKEADAEVDRLARELAHNYLVRQTPQPVSEWDYVAAMLLAQAFHHERGEYWRVWFPAMRQYFVTIQNPDGSWEIVNCVQCKALATSLALIALQTPRRLLPVQEQ